MRGVSRSIDARVQAQSSTRQGGHHWLLERLTSVALVPLTLWFVVAAVGLGLGSVGGASAGQRVHLRRRCIGGRLRQRRAPVSEPGAAGSWSRIRHHIIRVDQIFLLNPFVRSQRCRKMV